MLTSVRQIPTAFRWSGISLILATGLIHLVAAPDHYEEATYIGVLFSANLLGGIAAVIGIYRNELWGWWLGAAVAGGALAMFLVSRLIGLPGFEEHVGSWLGDSVEDNLGIPSLFIEAAFVGLFVWVITLQARAQALAQQSSPDGQKREEWGLILLIAGGVVLLIGHIVHLLFFS
jgi:hypothetical protein